MDESLSLNVNLSASFHGKQFDEFRFNGLKVNNFSHVAKRKPRWRVSNEANWFRFQSRGLAGTTLTILCKLCKELHLSK